MKHILHRANTRWHANHGWLDTYHTFSFADYRNPERVHFWALRVLNDDTIEAGQGFGTHPHDNMEIITIPLSGELAHKDSMGNGTVIRAGDIQVMSAGTGILHSEFNNRSDRAVSLLQIWVYPNQENVVPRYDQLTLNPTERHNKLEQVLSPSPNDFGVWIHQNVWFHLGNFDQGQRVDYQIQQKGNGAYIFVISGNITIEWIELHDRDGLGIWDTDSFSILTDSDAEILIIEVPMEI